MASHGSSTPHPVFLSDESGEPQWVVLHIDEYRQLKSQHDSNHSEETVTSGFSNEAARVASDHLDVDSSALVNLKALREQKHLSLEDMAKAAGISPLYMDMIEKGQRMPGEPVIRGLAGVLGVPLPQLQQLFSAAPDRLNTSTV
ncbi:helix-turn-helix domain-containing protein [Marinibactrum halimedae]|uniref:HTH cro/C1-type domain-containing protein n=1 Tax=Marinibactrum halimedae TaxID=1444977 RepID=A0AA37T901_9GAMM|nr:helix-turn-helix transcriptional regulator [Marinibactrum halimedae]MCD9460640.1 helix-turn-helix transcriptional regulator [Marinibactrum halimedae]GLS27856.1 hypothetical protein GCM10007877_35750 [Marinibactrum halimedae]